MIQEDQAIIKESRLVCYNHNEKLNTIVQHKYDTGLEITALEKGCGNCLECGKIYRL